MKMKMKHGMKMSHGGVNKKAKMMGTETGSHKAAGYPKGGQGHAPTTTTHAPDAMAHADLGGPVKAVKHYHSEG